MTDDYGGKFGNIRKVCDEIDRANGIQPDKTFAEIEAEKKEQLLNGLRAELLGYQQTAQQAAVNRTLEELKQKVSKNELEGENLAEAERMINNPSLITATAIDADFGDKMPRVKELLSLIANPEKAQEQADREDFISKMKGFSERATKK